MFEQAIQYVRENKTWNDGEDFAALETIDNYKCDIGQANRKIADEIIDLMEEFGENNGLPEGWWYEYGDEDDVFFEL